MKRRFATYILTGSLCASLSEAVVPIKVLSLPSGARSDRSDAAEDFSRTIMPSEDTKRKI